MTSTGRPRRYRGIPAASVAVLAATTMLGGCGDHAYSGALIGAGAGAIAGQAVGHNTESTLGGAAIGAGIGYIVGSEYGHTRRPHGGHGHGH